MSNSFDINKFNALVSQASDRLSCNSDCQQKRQAEKLKQIYLNSQQNLESAGYQEETAQKNYVVFTQGNSAYNNLQTSQLQDKADSIANDFNENFNEETRQLVSYITTYDGILINFNNIFDLYIKYKQENAELYKKYKDETNDVLTNERKTYYEDQNISSLKSYYFYFLLVIYVIFVICFGAFSLMYPSQTSWKIRLAMFIGFIALPFFSPWILANIVYLLYEAYNLLPKNVYR
jgi:hypothetical protein